MGAFDRVKLLIGEVNYQKLQRSHVAVFGIGGVGGIATESLVRSGVGEISIIDNDTVSDSNINRQIISAIDNVGEEKIEVMKKRLLSINPNLKINTHKLFYLPENSDEIDFSKFDYVIDAVDTVTAKILIIEKAYALNVPVISSMGTGGKIEPEKLKIAEIEKTSVCPLARVMRRELKIRNIRKVKVVYSTEEFNLSVKEFEKNGKMIQPSMMFVPSIAGLMLANEVVKDLINK